MISPLAHVHPKAVLGNNVQVDPFTVIHEDVVIGNGTNIASNVTIYPGARIGKNCHIYPGAVISAVPQDLKYAGEVTTTEIGDNTVIRECVTINKGTKAAGKTVVGSDCLLMAYVHIAHDCMLGNHCVLANVVTLAGHIIIDDHTVIGGLSAVHQFSHIGAHVMVGGGSMVTKDVPPFAKAARLPLSYLGVNSVGLIRRGFSQESVKQVQDIYRVIFNKGLPVTKALEEIESTFPASKERDQILTFIRTSSRGILKGVADSDED